jgi:hypothetical protein
MDLKLISTKDLIRELKSRRFVTDLLIGIEDVKLVLNDFNSELDTPMELTKSEMIGVINTLSNKVEDIAGEINNEIYGAISDIYESKEKKISLPKSFNQEKIK